MRASSAPPSQSNQPVRVFSQDESRLGLLTVRRCLTACGLQPVGAVQHVFEWFYVYGAVAPTTGERFFLELPYLNAYMFQIFLDALPTPPNSGLTRCPQLLPRNSSKPN